MSMGELYTDDLRRTSGARYLGVEGVGGWLHILEPFSKIVSIKECIRQQRKIQKMNRSLIGWLAELHLKAQCNPVLWEHFSLHCFDTHMEVWKRILNISIKEYLYQQCNIMKFHIAFTEHLFFYLKYSTSTNRDLNMPKYKNWGHIRKGLLISVLWIYCVYIRNDCKYRLNKQWNNVSTILNLYRTFLGQQMPL